MDAQWRATFVNDRLTEIMKTPSAEMLGKHVFEYMAPANRVRLQNMMERREQGIKETYQTKVALRDGSNIWLAVSASPLFDEQGRFAGSLAMVSDVTERAVAEQSVRESQQRFRTLVVHSPMGKFQGDLAGNCAFVNDRYCTLAGVAADECGNYGWLRTVHPEDRDRVLAAWREACVSHSEFAMEFRFLHDDGTVRWVFGSAVPLDGAGEERGGYLGNVLDITQRKQSEEALSTSEQRFRLLSDCSPVGIFLSDKVGNCIYTNPRLQVIFGYDSREFLGRGFAKIIHPDDRDDVLAAWFKMAPSCNLHSVERRYVNRHGKELMVHVRSAPLLSSSGEVLGRVGTVEDITDRREGEQQLRRSEERYRVLAENSTDMISKHTPDGVYLYVSPACRALLGYDPEELIGRSGYEFFHPEDLCAHRASITRRWPRRMAPRRWCIASGARTASTYGSRRPRNPFPIQTLRARSA